MSNSRLPTLSDLTITQTAALERVCDRFEEACRTWRNTAPRIEDYLDRIEEPTRSVLLAELVRLEVAYLQVQGRDLEFDDYRRRFPDHPWLGCVLRDAVNTLAGEYAQNDLGDTLESGETREDSLLGLEIPGYTLLKRLDSGGMGVVYQAKQKGVDRIVALKMILSGGHANQAERERFEIEAEAIGRLQHPNIVQIFEIGEQQASDGEPPRPFLALEYCSGGTLAQRLADSPMPPEESAGLVERLARAVQAAHEANVLHRDLKPANVMLTEDGTPKLTDFGLAKKLDQPGRTQTGVVMGSPSYMPPEQVEGRTKELGPASDVYSLGSILYECLTGRPPFKAATAMDTFVHVLNEEPVPPSQLNPNIPTDLETICLKCLRKLPSARYDSASSLAEDLFRFQTHRPITARPVSRLERLVRWCRRNRSLATALAFAACVLIVGGIVSTLFGIQATRHAHRAERQQHKAEALAKSEAKARRTALREQSRVEQMLYASQLGLARAAWLEENARVAWHHLDSTRLDSRGWEHDYLFTEFTKDQHTFSGPTDPVRGVCFSPDGRYLVSGGWGFDAKVWDTHDGRELARLQGHTGAITDVDYSPDGRWIVTASVDKTLEVWKADTGQAVQTLEGHKELVSCASFSPDGKQIVSGSWDSTIKLWDATNGQLQRTLDGHDNSVTSVSFSPDGRRVISSSDDSTVKVWDAGTGEELLSFKGHQHHVSSACPSPDGRRIASSSEDGVIKVWDARTGKEIFSLGPARTIVSPVRYSPDGSRIASGSWDGSITHWNARTGERERTLVGHANIVWCVRFSPDGRRIASGSDRRSDKYPGEVRLWNVGRPDVVDSFEGPEHSSVESLDFSPDGTHLVLGCRDRTVRIRNAVTGRQRLVLKGHNWIVGSVKYSPDGKHIVSGSYDKTVRIWDADLGREVRQLTGHTDWVTSVAFSPDGRLVASASRDKTVKVWDAHSGKEVKTLTGHSRPVWSVAFDLDGTRILSASEDKTVKVWDTRTVRELFALEGHTGVVNDIRISPDGKSYLSASGDHSSKVWDSETGRERMSLVGHVDPVIQALFSPDGQRIFSLDSRGNWKVWNARTGRELLTLKDPERGAHRICVSPDGKRVVTAGYDGSLKNWVALRGRNGRLVGAEKQKERIRLTRWARFDPEWHRARLKELEGSGDSFATAFHRARCAGNPKPEIRNPKQNQ